MVLLELGNNWLVAPIRSKVAPIKGKVASIETEVAPNMAEVAPIRTKSCLNQVK